MRTIRTILNDPLMRPDLFPANTFFCDDCGAEVRVADKRLRWNPNSLRSHCKSDLCIDCANASTITNLVNVGTVDQYYAQQKQLMDDSSPITFKKRRA